MDPKNLISVEGVSAARVEVDRLGFGGGEAAGEGEGGEEAHGIQFVAMIPACLSARTISPTV